MKTILNITANSQIKPFGKRRWQFFLLVSLVLCHSLNAQNTGELKYFNLVLPDNSMINYELTDGISIHFQDSMIVVNGLNYYMEDIVKYYFSVDLYYSLIVAANPTEGGIVNGGGNFLSGEICTVTAVPNDGYDFWCWVEEGRAVSTEANYSFTLSGPRNLVALFRPVSPNTSIIVFADPNVEMVCLEHWDADGDGYLSYDEATVVTDLGYVFEGNTAITSFDELQYFTGLNSIGNYAFYNCSGLTSFVLPSSVTTIGERAFYYCTGLGSVTIGENVTDIGHYAFAYCSNLTILNYNAINSNANNDWYGWIEFCPNLHTLNLGDSVQVVPDYAFYAHNVNFTGSLIIPSSVTSIGAYAFQGNGFSSLCVLAETPPALGEYVFDVNQSTPVYVPCNAVEPYENAVWGGFSNFNGLCGGTVTVVANPAEGGTVTGGGLFEAMQYCTVTATANEGYVFFNWTKDDAVVSTSCEYAFPVGGEMTLVANFISEGNIVFADANVKSICVEHWDTNGDGELSYAEAASVTDLSYYFQYNSDITSFNELQYFIGLSSIGDYAFYYCSGLTSIVLPISLKAIGYRAFYYCTGLTGELVIPKAATTIGNYAFYYCSNLQSIASLAVIPPSIGNYTFYGLYDKSLMVPCDALEVYQNADFWSNFTNILSMCGGTVTAVANPTEGGIVHGGGYYEGGELCTITAIANLGYAFLNWMENGTIVSTDVNYTFVVTGNRNLVANFLSLQSQSYHVDNIVRINRTNCSSLTQLSVLVPFPLTNQYQTISDETYIGGQLLSIPNTPNKYVRFLYNSEQLSNFGNIFDATVSFNAVLQPYVFDFSQISTIYSYDTSSPEYQQNTGASGVYIVPNHPTINSIAQNIWSVSSDIVDYARRCYEYVAQNYNYLNPGTGLHPLQELLTNGGGDCGNLSSIYISLLRNKSIPSRHVVTIRPDGSCNVWAEFYLENYGWIPVDVTAKQSNPNGNYFGVYDGNGIVVSKGICLTLERTPGDSYQCVLFQLYDWWFWHNNANLCNEITTQHIVNSGLQCSICVSANPSDGGCVTGEGIYNYGALCTLTATPTEGYSFIGWTKNGVTVSHDPIYTFTVTDNADFVANFSSTWSGSIVEIGDGTNTTYQFPVHSLYNYSFTEMIYTSEEIGTSGVITSLGFHFNGNNVLNRSVVVYMKNVSRSTFASSDDYENVTSTDIVYTGTLASEAVDGWVTLILDKPFYYNGTSNLMIALDDNTGSRSSRYFYYTLTTDAGLCYYNNNSNPEPYDLGSYSGSKIVSSKRPNVQLGITVGNGNELTVYDGTVTNGYVPVYGFYCDAYLKCEYIIPATKLSEMVGSNINAMTYYLSTSASDNWGAAHFQVFMKEVDFTSIGTYQGMDGATIVYEGPLDGTQAEMNIIFNTPYHYNGGDLLVGVYNTEKGSYKSASFYGEAVSGASVQGYSYSSLNAVTCNQRDFLPKTTFYYQIPNSYQQSLALQAGWNWFSTYLDITLDDLENALIEALPGTTITIKSQTQNIKYQNGRWTGSLTTLDKTRMYMISVENDCEITLEGMPIDPSNLTVTINNGANWLAFPYDAGMTVSDFFGSFPMNNDMVKSQSQNARYQGNRWGGQLGTLVPGKGYIYNSAATGTRTFVFPASAK